MVSKRWKIVWDPVVILNILLPIDLARPEFYDGWYGKSSG